MKTLSLRLRVIEQARKKKTEKNATSFHLNWLLLSKIVHTTQATQTTFLGKIFMGIKRLEELITDFRI